jgi:hypothetical protein
MPTLIPVAHDPFNDPPTDLIPVDHDPFDPLAASAGVAPAGTPRIDQIDWGQPSWAQQATAQSQRDREAYARGGVPEMMRDMEVTQDLAGGFGGGGIAGVTKGAGGIRAFHGSPHDFERFDISKIGTGEGAQAYGYGLYFAENPKVAETYDPRPESGSAAAGIGLRETTPGHMYEVNIAADPEHFLDWDKPLSEQHPKVQEAASASGIHSSYAGPMGTRIESTAPMGELAKDKLTRRDSLFVQKLRDAGIPGIKYLDQGSRGSGTGTSNYVVFDDKLIDIIKKYGLAGLVAGGAAHFSTQQVDHDPFATQ